MKNRIQSAYKVNSSNDMPSNHGKSNFSGFNSNQNTQRLKNANSSLRIINHNKQSVLQPSAIKSRLQSAVPAQKRNNFLLKNVPGGNKNPELEDLKKNLYIYFNSQKKKFHDISRMNLQMKTKIRALQKEVEKNKTLVEKGQQVFLNTYNDNTAIYGPNPSYRIEKKPRC